MHALLSTIALLGLAPTNANKAPPDDNSKRYVSLSRFTDPKGHASLLDDLPDDVRGIQDAAGRQVVRPDQRARLGISRERWKKMREVWPPRVADVLKALKDAAPHNLRDDRPPGQRVVGTGALRSYLLAAMLRYRLIPARVRAGSASDSPPQSPGLAGARESRPTGEAEADKPADLGHYSDRWACECWDGKCRRWRLLDVGAPEGRGKAGGELPAGAGQFEYAAEAWKRMRRAENVYSEVLDEGPRDYRSRLRSQLLRDFASLLNHDLAGCDAPSAEARKFLEERAYSDLSNRELDELDRLAELLSADPGVEELVTFYRKSPTLRLESAENDPYSYVHR
jgi:hypothetical protein